MAKEFCKHYRGMCQKDQCEAGVAFADLPNAVCKEQEIESCMSDRREQQPLVPPQNRVTFRRQPSVPIKRNNSSGL